MKLGRILPAIVVFVCVVMLGSLLLAQATQPAQPADPAERMLPENAVIRLPDGREVNLADLQRDGNVAMSWVTASSDGTTTNITDQDGRKITITDGPDGITITVKEPDKDEVEYHAASEEELKQNHPEAYELYEKHSHKEMMAGMRDGGGGGTGFEKRIMIRHDGDAHGGMVEGLGALCSPLTDAFAIKQLGGGVVVLRPGKDTFAEKIGLEQYDLIRSINGKPVKSVDELSAILNEADKITLEVVRGGQVVKLEEK